MSLMELYRELHGEPMPDEVQVRLLKIEKAMGIRDNDALWSILLAMDYYYRLLSRIALIRPPMIGLMAPVGGAFLALEPGVKKGGFLSLFFVVFLP